MTTINPNTEGLDWTIQAESFLRIPNQQLPIRLMLWISTVWSNIQKCRAQGHHIYPQTEDHKFLMKLISYIKICMQCDQVLLANQLSKQNSETNSFFFILCFLSIVLQGIRTHAPTWPKALHVPNQPSNNWDHFPILFILRSF